MNEMPPQFDEATLEQLVTSLNSAFESYSDKDWSFSRIILLVRRLENLDTPYVLWPEFVDLVTKQGRADMKALSDEIKWGERHSSELGILEIVSLRINKALLTTNSSFWQDKRPVLRLAKKDLLLDQGVRSALWYEIQEVTGEEFESR
jgi:hypothetical protein